MADLNTAFCTPFGPSPCAINFDLVPLYKDQGGDNRQFLGVVTIEASDKIRSYEYRVYPAASTPANPFGRFDGPRFGGDIRPHPLLQQGSEPEGEDLVTQGVVTSTNNMTFTFPVASLNDDYFVLLTPYQAPTIQQEQKPSASVYTDKPGDPAPFKIQAVRQTSSASGKTLNQPQFAIFYTSRVQKERKRRIQQRSQPVPEPFLWHQPTATAKDAEEEYPIEEKPSKEPSLGLARTLSEFAKTDEFAAAQSWIHSQPQPQPRRAHPSTAFQQKMTRSETAVGDRLKAMEEDRRLDDIKMRKPKASPRPTFAAERPVVRTFLMKNDDKKMETEAEELNFDLVANKKKLRYTEGTDFVPATEASEKWADIYPSVDIQNKNFIHVGHCVGINTVVSPSPEMSMEGKAAPI